MTSHLDIINALFELGAFISLTFNCRRLYRDKCVKGVSIVPVIFYSIWGYYNIYFYPMTGNIWSGVVAGLVALVNTTWCAMALYYTRKEKQFLKTFKDFPETHNDMMDAVTFAFEFNNKSTLWKRIKQWGDDERFPEKT